MADRTLISFEGFKEFEDLLDEFVEDFGQKDAKRILQRAVKSAMAPVLADAMRRAPVDTGALEASLRLEARKPNNRDRRSKYVDKLDVVISSVTTAPGWKLKKTKFKNQRTGKTQVGVHSDMRAIAQEFGTANVPAKPYLRPALEANSAGVVDSLGESLKQEIERYKAKAAKRTTKLST